MTHYRNIQMQLQKYLPWINDLGPTRYAVLLNIAFNIGISGLVGFHRMLSQIQDGNYIFAAQEMLTSKWAKQVGDQPASDKYPIGGRAWRLAQQMQTGKWK